VFAEKVQTLKTISTVMVTVVNGHIKLAAASRLHQYVVNGLPVGSKFGPACRSESCG